MSEQPSLTLFAHVCSRREAELVQSVISEFGERGCAMYAGTHQVLLLFKKGDSRMIQSPHDGDGELHVAFDPMLSSIEHVRAGRLRALAVTTATRSEALPDIPTVDEFVRGYESFGWVGVGVPRNTPVDIIAKLNGEINAGLSNSRIRARLADLGSTTLGGSPADFGKLIAEQTDRWAQVIRVANIKPD